MPSPVMLGAALVAVLSCVHPRRGGPLDAPARSVRVVASAPITVERLW